MKEKVAVVVFCVTLLFCVSTIAPAYVIVLKEGRVYSIESKPEINEDLVLFRLNGRLVSLRRMDLDVAKTQELNRILHKEELFEALEAAMAGEKPLRDRLEEYELLQEELRKQQLPKGWIRDEVGGPPHLQERRKWAPGYPKPVTVPELPEQELIVEIPEELEAPEELESPEEFLEKGWIRDRPGGPPHLEERKKWGPGEDEERVAGEPSSGSQERLTRRLIDIEKRIAEEEENFRKLEELRSNLDQEQDLSLEELDGEEKKINTRLERLQRKRDNILKKLAPAKE